MGPGLATGPRRARAFLALATAALVGLGSLAGCSSDDAPPPRDPGTTLAGTAGAGTGPCAGIPPAEQRAEGIEVVRAFDGADGAEPWGSLVLWQGRLYGRTQAGGDHGGGVVFGVGLDGSGYEVLRSLTAGPDGGEGNRPRYGHMSTVRGLLYSTAATGGEDDHGTLITLDPDTAEHHVAHRFGGPPADGAQPDGSFLVTSRGLWSLTAAGGAHDLGAIVKLDPDTEATELAHSFSGPDGARPHGRVVRSGEKTLYGMTSEGGSADAGVIFSMDPDAYELQVIHELGSGPDDGARPHHGHLTEGAGTDRRLWGLTAEGGAHGQGTLFTISPVQEGGAGSPDVSASSSFEVHHSFGASPEDASTPLGSLTWADGHFYGLSSEGGRYGLGSVFRLADDGSGYEVLASFGGSETGAFPRDDVLAYTRPDLPPVLYGTTSNGGRHDPDCQQALGVVFRLDLADLGERSDQEARR